MKRLSSAIILFAFAHSLAAQAPQTVGQLAESFSTPPPSAGVYVWWHWMDGNVTRDGIRKDLLWMKDSGIAGLHQFDAGGRPVPQVISEKVHYMSPEWKEDFRYAIALADSLGMEITVASAPGWSNTGGPWVTPEDAMKKLVWSVTEVQGGSVKVQLPEPPKAVGQYQDLVRTEDVEPWGRDVAVVAVKLPGNETDLGYGKVSSSTGGFTPVQLSNGSFADAGRLPRGGWVEWEFDAPVTVKAVTVGSEGARHGTRANPARIRWILLAGDGKDMKRICGIPEGEISSMTLDIPPTTARRFRLENPEDGDRQLSEFRLYSTGRVNHAEEKAGFSAPHDFASFPTPEGLEAVEDVLVLQDCMDADGMLECKLPEGRWRIYRFGQSLTGKMNHPASPDATGLEVDKYDPAAWERYMCKYVEMYREAAGGMLGGRGISRILVDSYEAGQQTWTPGMQKEFEERCGYGLLRWLPAVAGEIIGSPQETERFLWDWRRVQGELIAENYGRIGGIVARYGMQGTYLESHENGRTFVGDGMALKESATVPQSAIWMHDSPSGSKVPMAMADIRESASVAHIWGQNIAAAESFTASGRSERAYTYCPENIKYVADVAMSCGLNRFVVHESASQPSDDVFPGTGLFNYGQWFNRHETWAPFAGAWTSYLSRSCNVLQAGRFVSDILFYYGEDNCITGLYGHGLPGMPDGYAWDFINADGLLNMVEAVDGKLITKSGMSYSVLVLGENCRKMSVRVLRRICALAAAGVTVCGTVPEEAAGLSDDPAEFQALKDFIWTLPTVRTAPAAEVIAELEKDFTSTSADMKYVHRSLPDGTDIYWVRNFSGFPGEVTMTFRSAHRKAFVMHPENGRIEGVQVSERDGRAVVTVPMTAADAVFVVLHSSAAEYAPAPPAAEETVLEIEGPWSVAFQEKRGAPAEATFPALVSFTENPDPGIKYFSGIAVYTKVFRLSARDAGSVRALDLGSVKNVAEVRLNGQLLGIVWREPFVVDGEALRGALRKGENTLEIRVANLWRNRIIGDEQPGAQKITSTPDRFYTASSPLLPSGLLGPVRLLK